MRSDMPGALLAFDEEVARFAPYRRAGVAVGGLHEVGQEIPAPGWIAVVDVLARERPGELLAGRPAGPRDRHAAVALGDRGDPLGDPRRSEEHTSELQSHLN